MTGTRSTKRSASQLGQLLTAGTNLFNGSELMGRLDPLSLFSPVLRTSLSAAVPPRQDGRRR